MNILLLEPTYTAKYPPLGLMKIASYHKHCRNDFVWFSKGPPPAQVSEAVRDKLLKSKYYGTRYDVGWLCEQANAVLEQSVWDRVYITTLFTYEWQKTVDMIALAKTLVLPERIYVGGVLATLMPEEIEAATGIMPLTGLLRSSNVLGFNDDVDIDLLTPDYSILDNTEYTYFCHDAYLTSCTKGCGMKCSFCAVQRLEPIYECYRPLAAQIAEIDKLYGPRKNLILLDNNVLLSKCFDKIIEEIIALGFGRGATFISPETGKPNQRIVDFNQGLDANLLTPHKAAQLARLAISPARIAFDHIDDREKYLQAVALIEQAGIDEISNYLLYNTPNFSGKGKPRHADLPEDLYERMRINLEFVEQANEARAQAGRPPLRLYSYPMGFVPLDGKDRSYTGENWCPKTKQGLRRMLHLTKGVAYARRPIFEAIFGESAEVFMARLWMPAHYIEQCCGCTAALSSENTRYKDPARHVAWGRVYDEWMRLLAQLSQSEKADLFRLVSDADYSLDQFCCIEQEGLRRLYLHNFSSTALVAFLEQLRAAELLLYLEAIEYLRAEGRSMVEANELLLARLKSGPVLIAKLRRMVNVHIVRKAYRPRIRPAIAENLAA